jgi:hypothetical protein
MKTRNVKSNLLSAFMLVVFVLVSTGSASADAWWGKGYREPAWVLSHGGTIIKYEISNISGKSGEYKAVMYDKKGKYVEKEFGTKAKFDDAKNNVYTIKAYRVEGKMDKTTHKGGKSFASIKVTAHPGETISLKFDYKKKKVKMTTDHVKPAPKPVAKPVAKPVVEPVVVSEPEPEVLIQQDTEPAVEPAPVEAPVMIDSKKTFFDEFIGNMGKDSEQLMRLIQGDNIKHGIVEKNKSVSIFKKLYGIFL